MAKLRGAVITVGRLAKMMGISRAGAIAKVKYKNVERETPCSRCGAAITLIRKADADDLIRKRNEKRERCARERGQK